MKKLFLATLVLPLLFFSCSQKCETTTLSEVYCFIDVTDTVNFNLARTYFRVDSLGKAPIYTALKPAFSFDNCCAGVFRLYMISDVGENSYKQVRYPKEGFLPADATEYQIKEDASVKSFKTCFGKIFDEITSAQDKNKNQTKIYLPVCKALNELNKSKADRKVLIIFSDMLENSSLFSFYKDKSPDPEKIVEKLEEVYGETLPSLKDIEVIIVSKRVPGNDEAIDRASKFWKSVFTDLYPAKTFKSGGNLSIE